MSVITRTGCLSTVTRIASTPYLHTPYYNFPASAEHIFVTPNSTFPRFIGPTIFTSSTHTIKSTTQQHHDDSMRPTKACVQCRSGKRRCDGVKNAACIQCVRRHLPCSAVSWDQSSQSQIQGQYIAPTDEASTSYSDFDSEHLSSLIDYYFRFINDKPHSLFHEPSFRASVATGKASPTVLRCMMAMCARFSPHEDVRACGPRYIAEAKRAVKNDLENVCIENIQACIMVGNIVAGDCDTDAESLYFGGFQPSLCLVCSVSFLLLTPPPPPSPPQHSSCDAHGAAAQAVGSRTDR